MLLLPIIYTRGHIHNLPPSLEGKHFLKDRPEKNDFVKKQKEILIHVQIIS